MLIFSSKDRAMQLDAAIRSLRYCCKDLAIIRKYIIFCTTSNIHAEQYRELQIDNPDFAFVEEKGAAQQILEMAGQSKFVTFHCDDNIYINTFSFSEAGNILDMDKNILTHSFRLAPCIVYCYVQSKPEVSPQFTKIDNDNLRYNRLDVPGGDFGYPLELSASIYRCSQILPAIKEQTANRPPDIESSLNNIRNRFDSFPYMSCGVLPSVFNLPINQVGSHLNKAGTIHSYPIELLSQKFSDGLRIDITKFMSLVPNSVHMEMELFFEKKGKK